MHAWEYHYMQQRMPRNLSAARTIKTWNNLPDNLRSSSSFHNFKIKLKLMLTLES